jgi:hypothetical protein
MPISANRPPATRTTTIQDVVRQTLERVHAGPTPAEAAGEMLTAAMLRALGTDQTLALARRGLADLVADELHAERMRRHQEARDQEEAREAERRQQEAAERARQREERLAREQEQYKEWLANHEEERRAESAFRTRLQTDESLRAEVKRLHDLTDCRDLCCTSHTGWYSGLPTVYWQAKCLGGWPRSTYLSERGSASQVKWVRSGAFTRK